MSIVLAAAIPSKWNTDTAVASCNPAPIANVLGDNSEIRGDVTLDLNSTEPGMEPRLSLLSTTKSENNILGVFIPDVTYVIPQSIKDVVQTTRGMLQEVYPQNTSLPVITEEYMDQMTTDIVNDIDLEQHKTYQQRIRYLPEDLLVSKFKTKLSKKLQDLVTTANESEAEEPLNIDHILLTLTEQSEDTAEQNRAKKKKGACYRIRKFFAPCICWCDPDPEEDRYPYTRR